MVGLIATVGFLLIIGSLYGYVHLIIHGPRMNDPVRVYSLAALAIVAMLVGGFLMFAAYFIEHLGKMG
jgi:hypothetical protein